MAMKKPTKYKQMMNKSRHKMDKNAYTRRKKREQKVKKR